MKIYFTGSTSVGKTTIARYTAQKFNLSFINEVARSVLAEKELNIDMLRTNLDVVDSYQETIFYRQIQEENKYDNFVSDRSFDNLAYCASYSRVLNKLLNSQELKDYIEKLKQKDVIIFFVRPNRSTMKQDGVRETIDWDAIISVDGMIKFMLEMFDLNYININTPSIQERIKLVDTVINYSRKD
jgi:nicotinamide riboside kinase